METQRDSMYWSVIITFPSTEFPTLCILTMIAKIMHSRYSCLSCITKLLFLDCSLENGADCMWASMKLKIAWSSYPALHYGHPYVVSYSYLQNTWNLGNNNKVKEFFPTRRVCLITQQWCLCFSWFHHRSAQKSHLLHVIDCFLPSLCFILIIYQCTANTLSGSLLQSQLASECLKQALETS